MKIKVSVWPETMTPEEAEEQNECPNLARTIHDIIAEAAREGDARWGWCTVRVRVTLNGVRGEAFLGQCSYIDEMDFIKNSGYFSGMVADAIADCRRRVDVGFVPRPRHVSRSRRFRQTNKD